MTAAGADRRATRAGGAGGAGPRPVAVQARLGRGRRLLPSTLAAKVATGIAILGVWQLAASFAPDFIARPSRFIPRIPAVVGSPQFLGDAGGTLLAVVEGLAIAVVAGAVIGLLIGRLRDLDRAVRLYVNSFYAMPIIALVPLLTVWFGYSPQARLAVVVIEAAIPVIFNVAEGGRSVPREYVEVARAYRAPWWRVWVGVAVPASLPYLLAGLDLAIGRALVAAVVAEFITAIDGLGYYILSNVRSFHQDDAVVAVLALIVFAVALRALTNLGVGRTLRWYRPA